jgi:tetratricopeptide (TPR) repeat protein
LSRRAVVLAVVVVLVAATAVLVRRPREVRRDPGLSVLLVSIDTLRADALGCYGRAEAGTPWIDRLAASGVRFETARAHNVVTLPSHVNLLTGRLPTAHGVRDNAGFRLPAGVPTLATILRDRGYRTGAFVSALVLDSRFGLDRGFEAYDDRLGAAETGGSFAIAERKATRTVNAARLWIDSMAAERWFAFVHLYEPHFPYAPPAPFAARFASAPYQGEVAAADAALEPLLRPILEGKMGRVLVVLTSDHGESLGEHGEATHGLFAYESTLRVPLVLHAPVILPPAVVRTPARHVDVLPTVLDALGLPPPEGADGQSLLEAVAGRPTAPGDTYFEALSASLDRGWAPLRGLVSDGLKYVDLPLPELYDLREDPREDRNLAATRPGDLERLRARLTALRANEARPAAGVAEDRGMIDALRALGYVAAGGAPAKEAYGPDDDPKRLVDLDAAAAEALRRHQAGDEDGAAEAFRALLNRRPDMPAIWLELAAVERARGDLDAAIAAAREACRRRPLDAAAASLLGAYLTEGGHAADAIRLLEPFAEGEAGADPDVLTSLGMAQAGSGATAAALATFGRILERDPTNARALVNIGTVHLMAGERDVARQAFEAALDFDGDVARAHNALGVIAAEEGRWEEAVERWRRAAALDPRDYQALFNLGRTLRERGRSEEARPFLERYLRVAPPALEARDIARARAWLEGPVGR